MLVDCGVGNDTSAEGARDTALTPTPSPSKSPSLCETLPARAAAVAAGVAFVNPGLAATRAGSDDGCHDVRVDAA